MYKAKEDCVGPMEMFAFIWSLFRASVGKVFPFASVMATVEEMKIC